MMLSLGSSRRPAPLLLIYVAILAVLNPQIVESANRRRDLAVLNSDEFAEAVLTIQEPDVPVGFSAKEHAKITSALDTTRELFEAAHELGRQKKLKEGKELMEKATVMFSEVKDYIRQRHLKDPAATQGEISRELLRKKYADHDVQKALEDEERGHDVSRRLYETVSSFYNCIIFYETNITDFILQHSFIYNISR